MSEKFFSEKNLKFTLFDVHEVESLTKHEYFQEYNRESFEMIIDTAKKIAQDHMHPVFTEMDKQPPQFIDNTIKVHPSVKPYIEMSGEGGWINATFPYKWGGQQMPLSIFNACMFIFAAANYSLSVYPGLTAGAASLIYNFGSEELQEQYASVMTSGKWQGTMALTEPEAGSSLGDIRTTAVLADDGYYLIKGQKTFISAGDHDAVDNIIHLMLARIKGAPEGVKGLSLFLVPKKRLDENGELVFNDLHTAGCYHKMGYRGAPIAQLSIGEEDDCRGWLIGEANQGIKYMFHMMNESRISVGVGATGIASAAYYASLNYSMERTQGRKATEKDMSKPQVPIIEHANIRRMLLSQRSIVEGSLSLIIYCAKLVDLNNMTGDEEKENLALLLDFLTPLVKSYPSEMGITSTSQAIQCFGGYGYSDEFPVEQHLRDARIHPIHEGTTGIQGMDLLGRKVTMKGGKAYELFMKEIQNTIDAAQSQDRLSDHASALKDAQSHLASVTKTLLGRAMKGNIEHFLADATLYLELTGIITIAWQWLIMGIKSAKAKDSKDSYGKDFHDGKLLTMTFFYEYELPKIQGLAKRLMSEDTVTLNIGTQHFED